MSAFRSRRQRRVADGRGTPAVALGSPAASELEASADRVASGYPRPECTDSLRPCGSLALLGHATCAGRWLPTRSRRPCPRRLRTPRARGDAPPPRRARGSRAFLERSGSAGAPVARFVEREIRSYLECGVFAHGFLCIHCEACGHDRLVAFSCKGVTRPRCGFPAACSAHRARTPSVHRVESRS
jgi:hypothetical protein